MSAHRPRWRGNGRCAGCGEKFLDLDAFTKHATGTLEPSPGSRRRCRDQAEMRAMGMRQTSGGAWVAKYSHG